MLSYLKNSSCFPWEGYGIVCVRVVFCGLFSTPSPPKLWLGSWFCKEFVWADLSIRAAPMECEMQAVAGLVPFRLLAVFFGRKDWLSVLMLGVVTTAFCVQGELTASWVAVEKQQKKRGMFLTSCDSKASSFNRPCTVSLLLHIAFILWWLTAGANPLLSSSMWHYFIRYQQKNSRMFANYWKGVWISYKILSCCTFVSGFLCG